MGFSFYIYCIDRKSRVRCTIKLVEEKKEQRKQLNNRLKPCPFCGGKAQIEERSKPD